MKRLAVLFLFLTACSHALYPVTTGSHAPISTADRGVRYLVWSNHPGVTQYITSILLTGGYPVVERSRLETIFKEQRLMLSHSREEDILKVGRLVGATQVIFAEVRGLEKPGPWDRPPAQSVTVRGVSVESAEVRWTGLAAYPEAAAHPDQAVQALTYWAMARALCHGTWEEPASGRTGGCVRGQGVPVKTVEDRQEPWIWKEMRGMERR